MSRRPRRFVLIGPGRVGLALGTAWTRRGHRCVGVFGSTPGRRRRARRRLGAPDSGDAFPDFDFVLIATPDRSIREVAIRYAGKTTWRRRLAFHTAGALSASALGPLRRRGAAVASLHPLLSLSGDPIRPGAFRGAYFGVEGDPAAVREARRLVRKIGGLPLGIPARGKPAYHLAACLASGHLLALLSGAAGFLRRAGIPSESGRKALLRLARSALDNAARRGIARALTGPAMRGDFDTIRRHRRVLAGRAAGWREVYRWLTREMVREAGRNRRLSARQIRELYRELEEGRHRRSVGGGAIRDSRGRSGRAGSRNRRDRKSR